MMVLTFHYNGNFNFGILKQLKRAVIVPWKKQKDHFRFGENDLFCIMLI
jgi:hypothetical protein